jgi:hypothetical protein
MGPERGFGPPSRLRPANAGLRRARGKRPLLNGFYDAILAECQNGSGGGFDPREITTSYAHFLSILAEYDKRGTDPLGSTVSVLHLFGHWPESPFARRYAEPSPPALISHG